MEKVLIKIDHDDHPFDLINKFETVLAQLNIEVIWPIQSMAPDGSITLELKHKENEEK